LILKSCSATFSWLWLSYQISAPEVFHIHLLDEFLTFVLLHLRDSCHMSHHALNDVASILLDAAFRSTSANLAKLFPFPLLEQVVAIPKFDELLLQIKNEFSGVSVAKSEDHFLDFAVVAVLERGLDLVIVALGRHDLEDGLHWDACGLRVWRSSPQTVDFLSLLLLLSDCPFFIILHCF